MDLLRARMSGDIEAFAKAFPDRKISQEEHPGGGFTMRRGHYPEVRLTVEPNPNAGTLTVDYVFASQSGVLTPKPMFLELADHPAGRPHFRDDAGQHPSEPSPNCPSTFSYPSLRGGHGKTNRPGINLPMRAASLDVEDLVSRPQAVQGTTSRPGAVMSASLMERLAGFSAADASERLEDRLLR